MKTKIFTLLLLTIPFFVSAQNLTIASGATVTIGPGASVTTGEITNNAGNAGLVLESAFSATLGNQTGSLIYDNAGAEPDATVEVYVQEGGWHFVSSPVGNTTADVFLSPTDDVWIAEYDINSTSGEPWTYITSTTAPINKGQGYSYAVNYSTKADNNVSFSGKLVSQDFISSTLNYEDGVNTNPNNFTLLGNPFSAPIYVGALEISTDYEMTIWIWNQDLNDGSGGYEWASFLDPAPYPNPEMSPPTVAIGQGFFVRALTSNATIDFDPYLRQHESDVTFFKSSENDPIEVDYLKLEVSKDSKTDMGIVGFAENGTKGFENGYDATKMLANNGIPEIYFVEEGNRYCQNHLPGLSIESEQVVKMHFVVGETGEQILSVDLDNLPETYVLLEDLFTGKMIDLTKNPLYTFTAAKGDDADRFRLHFKYSLTGVEEGIANAVSTLDVYASNKAVFVTNKDNSIEPAKIVIYDMYGRTLYSNETQLSELTRIPLNVNNSYLVVRVVKGNEIYTEKVFIQ